MSDNSLQNSFLQELYRLTGGELDQQASMYDVGAGLALEKNEAGRLAEELMVEGLIDLKTLAGGICLTDEGLENLGYRSKPQQNENLQLGSGPIATDHDRVVIEQISQEIRQAMQIAMDYETTELLVIHLKTIEVQMLSEKPRLAVIKTLFTAILATMQEANISSPPALSGLA